MTSTWEIRCKSSSAELRKAVAKLVITPIFHFIIRLRNGIGSMVMREKVDKFCKHVCKVFKDENGIIDADSERRRRVARCEMHGVASEIVDVFAVRDFFNVNPQRVSRCV
jgi:hypothetical protein